MRWLISVPVWWEPYSTIFCERTLPALDAAIMRLGMDGNHNNDVRVIIHTDQSIERFKPHAPFLQMETRPLPISTEFRNLQLPFACLSSSHRDVLEMACNDDIVVLLTADMLVSTGTLLRCEELFLGEPSLKMVMCCGMRVNIEAEPLEREGKSAPELMKWAWENRHPMTEACRYPAGLSADLSRIYFEGDDVVIARLGLPHPLAVRKDAMHTLNFSPTIDANLFHNFRTDEIYLEKSSKQLAVIELSPKDKDFTLTGDAKGIGGRLKKEVYNHDHQYWAARQRVFLIGEKTNLDVAGDRKAMSFLEA